MNNCAECERLRAELEAARKVADAADEYDKAKTVYDTTTLGGTVNGQSDELLTAHGQLRNAVREYRAATEGGE